VRSISSIVEADTRGKNTSPEIAAFITVAEAGTGAVVALRAVSNKAELGLDAGTEMSSDTSHLNNTAVAEFMGETPAVAALEFAAAVVVHRIRTGSWSVPR